MQTRTYGLYDGVAKNYVRTFVNENDDTAVRACKYIVRERGFDPIQGRDLIINYLYTFDTETGCIIDNSIHTVCSLAQAIDEYKNEVVEDRVREQMIRDSMTPKKEVKDDVTSAD